MLRVLAAGAKGNENRSRDSQPNQAPAPKGRTKVAQYVEPGWALAHTLARKCWVRKERTISLRRRLGAQRSEAHIENGFRQSRSSPEILDSFAKIKPCNSLAYRQVLAGLGLAFLQTTTLGYPRQ